MWQPTTSLLLMNELSASRSSARESPMKIHQKPGFWAKGGTSHWVGGHWWCEKCHRNAIEMAPTSTSPLENLWLIADIIAILHDLFIERVILGPRIMSQRFAAAFQAFFQLASACRLSTATVRWSYLPKLTCEEAQAEMDEALKARLGLRLQDTWTKKRKGHLKLFAANFPRPSDNEVYEIICPTAIACVFLCAHSITLRKGPSACELKIHHDKVCGISSQAVAKTKKKKIEEVDGGWWRLMAMIRLHLFSSICWWNWWLWQHDITWMLSLRFKKKFIVGWVWCWKRWFLSTPFKICPGFHLFAEVHQVNICVSKNILQHVV